MPDTPAHGDEIVGRPNLDRAFRHVVSAGWANSSDGDVEAPTGHFARVSIADNELGELVSAVFDDDFTDYEPELATALVGHHLVIEDSNGLVWVYSYPSATSLASAFVQYQNNYERWHAGMGD